MKRRIDLHMHTLYSDGTSSPEELLELVRDSGIMAFSVTDHDTLEGYLAAREIVSENDPELIPGLELSVTVDGEDMHILAYLFDCENKQLAAALAEFQKRRAERGRTMVTKLNQLGIDITIDDVEKQAGGAVIGRPHVARAMFEKRSIDYYEEAFSKFIGSRGPAYVPKMNFTPQEALKLIHGADGLAVLAHPAIDNKDTYLEMLVDMGLDGIEVYHPAHSVSHVDRYKHLADRYRLVMTGGSDFHGLNGRYDLVGTQMVPYEYLETLKARK